MLKRYLHRSVPAAKCVLIGFLASVFALGGCSDAAVAESPAETLQAGRMTIQPRDYISQHNLVFLRPADTWLSGQFTGNGNIGVMKYGQPEELRYGICKTDLWDRRWGPRPEELPTKTMVVKSLDSLEKRNQARAEAVEAAREAGLSKQETNRMIREAQGKIDKQPGSWAQVNRMWYNMISTSRSVCTPKPAGELILRSDDVELRGDYNETTHIYDGLVVQQADTESGEQNVTSFMNAAGDCLVVHLSGPAARKLRRVELFRRPDETGGPKGEEFPVQWADLPPKPGKDDRAIWIRQDFPWGGSYKEKFHFVMMAEAEGCEYSTELGQTGPAIVLEGDPGEDGVTIYLTIVTTREADDPMTEAASRMTAAREKGYDDIKSAHARWWNNYWQKSMVFLPDKVTEQAWYLLLYQLACEARAGHQAPGLCALSTPNYTTPWGGDYHLDQNEQMMFWGCFTNNRLDLVKPYMALLQEWVPRGEWRAEKLYESRGIRWPLASDAEGNERTPVNYAYENWCQAAAASHFWFYYQYSQDIDWLREKGYPILKGSMEFYEHYMEQDEDGTWYIFPSIPPETRHWSKNPIADIAVIRMLLRACITCSEDLGVDPDEREKWKSMMANMSDFPMHEKAGTFGFSETAPWLFVVHPTVLAPMFPGNEVGLDSTPEMYDIGKKTLEALFDRRDEHGDVTRSVVCNITHGRGWMCIAAARLGLEDHTNRLLRQWISTFFQPNGFTPAWNSRFVEMEPITTDCQNVTTAIGEMLLQSYNGRIRVFPAVAEGWEDTGFYRLRAVGANLISAEQRDGRTAWVLVESEKGKPVTLVNPWPDEAVTVNGKAAETKADVIYFDTTAGESYLVAPADTPTDALAVVERTAEAATQPRPIGDHKHFGLVAPREGRAFAGTTLGEVINVDAVNDGCIREKKRWPGLVQNPADNLCRIEPLCNEQPFEAWFGIEYDRPREIRKVTVFAGTGHNSVFGGSNIVCLPKAYVLQYYRDGKWVDIPGTERSFEGREKASFPIVAEFEPIETDKVRLLIRETGTGRFRKVGTRIQGEFHNAVIQEMIVE